LIEKMMFTNLTLPELMQRIPDYFVPEKAVGIDARVLFHLTGNQAEIGRSPSGIKHVPSTTKLNLIQILF